MESARLGLEGQLFEPWLNFFGAILDCRTVVAASWDQVRIARDCDIRMPRFTAARTVFACLSRLTNSLFQRQYSDRSRDVAYCDCDIYFPLSATSAIRPASRLPDALSCLETSAFPEPEDKR